MLRYSVLAELLVLVTLVGGCGVSRPLQPARPASEAAAAYSIVDLQGTWVVVSWAKSGRELALAQKELAMGFEASRLSTIHGGQVVETTSFIVDESARPARISIQEGGKVTRGIYRIEGDTLTLCTNLRAEGPAPKNFDEGCLTEGYGLFVMKRKQAPAPAAAVAPSAATLEAMARVPAGPFLMGCDQATDSDCQSHERPSRSVNVGEFWIDRTEVSVAAYKRCVDAGKCSSKGVAEPAKAGPVTELDVCNWGKPERMDHPMNCIEWFEARTYCAWLGKRLPNEAEWEKAARGTTGRKYSWGNAGYGSVKVANVADASYERKSATLSSPGQARKTIPPAYDDGFVTTAPVGSFPAGASPYGALDMIGNVSEWVADPIDLGRFFRGYCTRGGDYAPALLTTRAAHRGLAEPTIRSADIGFRCASSGLGGK